MTSSTATGRQQHAKATLDARSEAALKRAIVHALNVEPGVFVFPMNVGAVSAEYKGKTRYVKFAFPGMADIIGWRILHLNHDVPCWLALEVKKPGQVPGVLVGFVVNAQARYLKVTGKALLRAEQQRAFLKMVRDAGGIAAIVTSVDEALEAVRCL